MQPHDSFSLRDVFRRERLPSLLGAFLLLGISYIAEHFANVYALDYSQRPSTNHVGDLILDNIPATDLNFIIIEVALAAPFMAYGIFNIARRLFPKDYELMVR